MALLIQTSKWPTLKTVNSFIARFYKSLSQSRQFCINSTAKDTLSSHALNPKILSCVRAHPAAALSTSRPTPFKEDSCTTALAVVDHVKQLRSSPKIALLLGTAGLAPFIAAPYYMISAGTFLHSVALYQTFYGATILSFLGGVRWGLTLPPGSSQSPDLHNLGYSVMPQLWGWSTLMAAHYMDCHVVGNVGVMLGLAVTGYFDLSMWGYPAWFKGLRFCLTLGAVLSLWTCLMCSYLLEHDTKKTES